MRKIYFFVILFFLNFSVFADEVPVYVLNESAVNDIYYEVKNGVSACQNLEVNKEIRGVVITIGLENPEAEYYKITPNLEQKLKCVEYFLAKIKNPVIIEVHTEKVPNGMKMKNWEFSSVIAAKVGDLLRKREPKIPAERISLVGYGEFMPRINTSNNGGNDTNRIDIIIQSSISGE